MKKNYIEAMNEYSEAEKQPVPHKKYIPPMIGDQDPNTNDTDQPEDAKAQKPGLWENIRKKKEREGKDYKPAKPGDKDRPDPESYKKAQSS
jgi:hypothetical protein